jgi:hypothetical protein
VLKRPVRSHDSHGPLLACRARMSYRRSIPRDIAVPLLVLDEHINPMSEPRGTHSLNRSIDTREEVSHYGRAHVLPGALVAPAYRP